MDTGGRRQEIEDGHRQATPRGDGGFVTPLHTHMQGSHGELLAGSHIH